MIPRDFRRARRGNYSMIMATAVVVILGFSAYAMDISYITMAELQAQSTADAASHGALVAYRNDTSPDPAKAGQDAADYLVRRNRVGMGTASLEALRFGSYDRKTDTFCTGCSPTGSVNAVEAEIARAGGNSVPLLLAPMFGVSTHEVDARSVSAQQTRAIMLIQDLSCSMSGGGSYPRAIDQSRRASVLFLDYLIQFDQAGDMLGLTGYARHGASEILPVGGLVVGGMIDPTVDYFARADDGTDVPWARLSLIATEEDYLRGQLAGICSTTLGCVIDPSTGTHTETPYPDSGLVGTCTNPAIAMRQAAHELATRTDPTAFRGMIVMSDGRFNCGGGNAEAYAAATEAFDLHDIHIWSVLYHNGSFSVDPMKNLTRGYGFFQYSPDPADLPTMYANIAAALPTAFVD